MGSMRGLSYRRVNNLFVVDKAHIGVSTFYRLDTSATYTVSGCTLNARGTIKFTPPNRQQC